jgi:hypothetical protein
VVARRPLLSGPSPRHANVSPRSLFRLVSVAVAFAVAALALPARPAIAQQDCISCPYGVSVTPDGATRVRAISGSSYVDTFTVTNTGTNTDTYTFSCQVTGGISCSNVNPTSATVFVDEPQIVIVTYTVAAPAGTLQLTATSSHATDVGSFVISTNPSITWVVPARSGTRAVVATRQPLIRSLFLPSGSGLDTTKTVLVWKHGASTDTVTKFRSDSLFGRPPQPRSDRVGSRLDALVDWAPRLRIGQDHRVRAERALHERLRLGGAPK